MRVERALAAELEELAIAGGVELQERRAVLKALGPLRPAARGVPPAHGEHRRALLRPPGVFDAANLLRRQLEQPVDPGNEVLGRACAVDANHQLEVVPQMTRESLSSLQPRENNRWSAFSVAAHMVFNERRDRIRRRQARPPSRGRAGGISY